MTYEQYILSVTDRLIGQTDCTVVEVDFNESLEADPITTVNTNLTVPYLIKPGAFFQDSGSFDFIGSDRDLVNIDSTEQSIQIADIITGNKPNYQQARFRINSGPNLQAWKHYLQHYTHKILIQYLKFVHLRILTFLITPILTISQLYNTLMQYSNTWTKKCLIGPSLAQ